MQSTCRYLCTSKTLSEGLFSHQKMRLSTRELAHLYKIIKSWHNQLGDASFKQWCSGCERWCWRTACIWNWYQVRCRFCVILYTWLPLCSSRWLCTKVFIQLFAVIVEIYKSYRSSECWSVSSLMHKEIAFHNTAPRVKVCGQKYRWWILKKIGIRMSDLHITDCSIHCCVQLLYTPLTVRGCNRNWWAWT